jgi:putative spermidine/putrescine transport system ATP-binding protein
VASFIGENNRFDGTLVARDGPSCRVQLADGTELSATVAADLAPGAAVCDLAAAGSMSSSARARVRTCFPRTCSKWIYQGDHCKLRMRVGGSDGVRRESAGGRRPLEGRRRTDGLVAGESVPRACFRFEE